MSKVFVVKPLKVHEPKARIVRAERKSQVENHVLADYIIEPVTDVVADELRSLGIDVEEAE